MLSEVVNALFVTYLATEIQLAADDQTSTDRVQHVLHSKVTQAISIGVLIVNLAVRLHIHVSGSTLLSAASSAVSFASHAPKVLFAAIAYVVALYFDCRRRSKKDLAVGDFLKSVGVQFCRVAPVYPFLAVMISFVFLFIISAFEALHLPLELLNMPIYYGTLYGPFSWIYYMVKKRIVESSSSLPSTMTAYYAR